VKEGKGVLEKKDKAVSLIRRVDPSFLRSSNTRGCHSCFSSTFSWLILSLFSSSPLPQPASHHNRQRSPSSQQGHRSRNQARHCSTRTHPGEAGDGADGDAVGFGVGRDVDWSWAFRREVGRWKWWWEWEREAGAEGGCDGWGGSEG